MGLDVAFWLNAGSTFSGGSEQTTWANQSNNDKYLGTIDLGNATNATLSNNRCQLEVGENASDFEHRSFGEELGLCQRYFYRWISESNYGNLSMGVSINTTKAIHFILFQLRCGRNQPLVQITALLELRNSAVILQIQLMNLLHETTKELPL